MKLIKFISIRKISLKKLTPVGVALGVFVSGSANAATIGSLPPGFNDAAFNALLLNGTIGELFVAENRSGNNGISGDREVGINQPIVPNPSPPPDLIGGLPFPGAQGQKVWGNGTPVAFTLSYNVTTNTVTYSVAGSNPSPLTATTLDENPSAIYIRTRATGASGGTATNLLSNLVLTDGSGPLNIGNLSSTGSPTSDVDYLLIENLTSSFTLTGSQTFSWNPTFLGGSNNASQFKVVYSIPEPLTILGSATALGFGTFFKRKLKSSKSTEKETTKVS